MTATGIYVQTNVRLFVGGADLTSRSNKVEWAAAVEDKDSTNYGSNAWKERIGGLGEFTVMGAGQWEAGDSTKIDDVAFAAMGAANAVTTCPSGAAVGNVAWLANTIGEKYNLGGPVGDVAPWTLEAPGTWPPPRGTVLHDPGTPRTSTGNGTGVQYVAASSSQFLYATLHVLSVAGTGPPTLAVVVQSSVDNTFAAPTTRITFTTTSSVGGQILRLAGPITDTWYRVTWTITGGSPSFLFLATVGIK